MKILDMLCKHLECVKVASLQNPNLLLKLNEAERELQADVDLVNYKEYRVKHSENLRNEGNAHFKENQMPEARHFYSQSISDGGESTNGILGYMNRSAALFQMRLYNDCITDIDRALFLGCPNKKLLHTLHLRKAKCLQFLKQDHTKSLEDALKAIDEHNQGFCEELKKTVLAKMDEPESLVFDVEVPTPNKWKLPELSYGPSEESPCFSSAVTIAYNKSLGRHLVANKPIKTGDVLIVEPSVVTAIDRSVHWEYCSFCFEACMCTIPCNNCPVMYCSLSCREKDWNLHHKNSCECTCIFYRTTLLPYQTLPTLVLDRDFFGDGMHVLLHRLVHVIGLDKIRSAALNNESLVSSWSMTDKRTRGFRDGKFSTVDLESFMSLEDNFDQLNEQQRNSYAQIALVIAAEHCVPDPEKLAVSAIFMKLLLVVVFNRKFLYSVKVNYELVGLPPIELGDVLYLASSLINHSCDPSMYQISYGTHAVYRARRPIRQGEHLTESYNDNMAAITNYETRHRYTNEVHKFFCRCEACEESWPMVNNLPVLAMRSAEVQPIIQAARLYDGLDEDHITKFFYFCQFNVPVNMRLLSKMVALLRECHKANYTKHQSYHQMQESIKNHYRTQGNCFFYKDAKEIIQGLISFDATDAIHDIATRMNIQLNI